MKRFQITNKEDWFSQLEIKKEIKNLKPGEKLEITRLENLKKPEKKIKVYERAEPIHEPRPEPAPEKIIDPEQSIV